MAEEKTWQEQLQPASFRKVPFHVEDVTAEIGRRVVVHEYPLRDDPYPEDLGGAARKYNFTAFLLGDDALSQRDDLEAALETKGPGTLIHPYYGALKVQLINARPRYNSRKQRLVSYSLSFVKAGKQKFPETKTDTTAKVNEAVNKAVNEAEKEFAKQVEIKGPASLLDTAKEWLDKGLDKMRSLNGRISAIIQPISEIASKIDAIGNELTTLILLPRTLASSITSAIGAIIGIGGDIQRALDGYKHLGATIGKIDKVPETTPTRIQQASNRQAIINLLTTAATLEAVRSVAIASQARDVTAAKSVTGVTRNSIATSSSTGSVSGEVTDGSSGAEPGSNNSSTDANASPFTSYQHAIEVRDELIEALDVIAQTAGDELYIAITDTQVQLQRHIAAHGARLQRINTYSLLISQPALVVAHNLYGDATRADDIVARNQIAHPGFLPAAQKLEVLNV